MKCSAFCGGIFEFEIGFRKFALHRSLMSRVSPALCALMKNGMRELQERIASISDVDEATFARFAEFIYTGDFNAPPLVRSQEALETVPNNETNNDKDNTHAPDIQEAPPEPEPPLDVPAEPVELDPWEGSYMSKKDKKKRKQKESAMVIRHERLTSKLPQPDLDVAVILPLPTSSTVDHQDGTEQNDYTAVFFCHAKLYVLAETYGVEQLKKLSSDRLNKSFIHYEQSLEPSANIPGLLRYVFENTPERRSWCMEEQSGQELDESRTDTLQDICVRFAANNTETLMLSPAFRSLLRDGGSFVEMYFESVAERLAWLR